MTIAEQTITKPTLYFRFMDARYFRDLLKVLSTFNAEVTISFNKDGLKTLQMDPSHVTLLELNLPKTIFDDYDVNYGVGETCLNLETVTGKAFKNIRSNEDLSLDLNAEKATFTLSGTYKRNFTIATLEPVTDEIPKPKLSSNVVTKIAIDVLDRIIKDVKNISEYLVITGLRDRVTFSTKSYDVEDYQVSLDKTNENMLSYVNKADEKQIAKYSLTYLADIVTSFKRVTDVIKISFSRDMPIEIEAELREGSLKFWMAPRIEAGG